MTFASNPSTSLSDEKVGRFLDLLRPEVKGLGVSEEDFQKNYIEGEKNLRIKSRFRKLLQEISAEALNTMVVVVKRVDYTQTPQQAISAMGREEYLTNSVVETMPRLGEGIEENVEAVCFKLNRYETPKAVAQEFADRELDPDPYLQAALNEEDPAFADTYPNGTQWDLDGNTASYLTCNEWDGERDAHCARRGHKWGGLWWFVGRRKKPLDSSTL